MHVVCKIDRNNKVKQLEYQALHKKLGPLLKLNKLFLETAAH